MNTNNLTQKNPPVQTEGFFKGRCPVKPGMTFF